MKVSDDQYRACAAAGMSATDAVRHLGVNRSSVYKAAKRLGITFVDARSECMRRLNADPAFAKARDDGLRKLHADPAFAKANAERAAERMRKLHADPAFAAKVNSLAHLTPEQRADYNVLKKNGYSRAEAFKAIGVTA